MDYRIQQQKPRKWPWILLIFFLIVCGTGWYAYTWLKNLTPEKILQSDFVIKQVQKQLGEDKAELFELLPDLLGFTEPKTYLILFLNNTELRPGGGFIGSYATITMDKGSSHILVVEGSERLDARAPESFNPAPVPVLASHLKVNKWYFRDSNWSPDFVASSQKGLELYAGEGGVATENIDAVVGITTTVLEELLRITGPITVQGFTFTADNVVEELQYEVEYGFKDRDVSFENRKQIIEPFMRALMDHVTDSLFKNADAYAQLFDTLVSEKHVFIYAKDEVLQQKMDEHDWSGRMHETSGDYLMWVDANLAALKTDLAIDRHLSYTVSLRPPAHESEKFYYLASAKMTYTHSGSFDWRTTRYRTYARVYVPLGSQLVSTIGAMKWDRTAGEGPVDQGIENGRQWFGAFVAIEPGQVGEIQFIYKLPESVERMIDTGMYTFFVQKQLGTIGHDLTLDLDFGKTIKAAKPGEVEEKWNDSKYELSTDLRVDREFSVNF
ncbi:MAG TPA: hypothetical protein DCS29_03310 [Candidatus Magasanikbacteria bacterium]|nr:hypothetical protein [Candidatus Magasanikbacteria bacterium]